MESVDTTNALAGRADFEAIAQWVRPGAQVLDLGTHAELGGAPQHRVDVGVHGLHDPAGNVVAVDLLAE